MSLIPGLAAIATATVLSGQAAPPAPQGPGALERMLACRATTDSAARLACYDTAAGALDTARSQGDLVVMDRAQINETRRQAFGFSGLSLPRLFGSNPTDEVQSIETTLESASQIGNGDWVFRLADGSVWRQTDNEFVDFRNRAGQPVRVRKAALSSYLLTLGNSRAVRVRRQ